MARDLAASGMPLDRATALAVRLLDLGYVRIGSDVYADANGSFGLTTLERQHVRRSRGGLVFTFTGKSGVEHSITIDDADVAAALAASAEPGDTVASRRRAVKAAVAEVAGYFGNTPTVAKDSYIDPRVLDLYESGVTLSAPRVTARTSPARRQALLEQAVLDLLAGG